MEAAPAARAPPPQRTETPATCEFAGQEAAARLRPATVRASVAVVSCARDPGVVDTDAPYAVGAVTGFTFGRDRPSTQPTPHMRKRRAFHGHTLHRHIDTRGSFSRAATAAPSSRDKPPPEPRKPPDGSVVAVTVTALLHRRRDRTKTLVPAPRAGDRRDRNGRDRTEQRAAALRSLDRMHRLEPGDRERATLREAVIAEYMPYARHIAARYGVRGQCAEDFLQAAYVGLVKAVDNFDPDFGAAFLTYATPTILGELKRYFRDTTWAVHVPRRIQELSSELRAATETLSQRLNRAPTVDELAVLLGADPSEVVDAIDATGLHAVGSLDVPAATEDGGGSLLGELLGADDPDLRNVVDRETLRPLLATLSAREKKILLLRYFRSMTQTEIGEELGVSQMQVSRLLADILARLRARADCDGN
jgi:RNA polymerase sigma-B factor